MEEEVARANWNFVYEKGFLDILNGMKVENRCMTQNGWTTEGWNIIYRRFKEKFPLARYSKHHLQEKNKDLKANYKAIRDARKESGAGFDSITGMVTGGPNVWDRIDKYHKKVAKFRKKGFLHYNSCESLYEGSIATGDLSFTSVGANSASVGQEASDGRVGQEASGGRVGEESSEAQSGPPFTVAAGSASVGAVAASSTSVGVVAASSTSIGAAGGGVGPQEATEAQSAPSGTSTQEQGGRKRKQSQVAAALDDYLDHKKVQSEKTMEALLEKKRRQEEYSIEKCLDTTNGMDELTDEDKAIAAEVFENDVNREMFMKQKDHNVRLIWLRRKIRRLADI